MDARFRDTAEQDRPVAPQNNWRRMLPWACAAILSVALIARWLPNLRVQLSTERSVAVDRLSLSTVEISDLTRDISVDGEVAPTSAPTLYATSPGLVNFRVHAGEIVDKNSIVATVDSPEMRNKLAQEQAALAVAEVEQRRTEVSSLKRRATAEEQYERAEVDLRTSQREYQRTKQAFDKGAYPEVVLLAAQDKLEKAQFGMQVAANAKNLDSRIDSFEIESKRLARDKQRLLVSELQREVDALTIRAPVSGRIGQLLVADRTSVAQGVGLLTIVDLSSLELDIKMPESLARDAVVGLPAQIAMAGTLFNGEVTAVSPSVVQGQVAARVRFVDSIPKGLRANQRLSVRVILDRRTKVLTVANGPWVQDGGGQVAYVVNDNVAERRRIAIGATSVEKVEIVSGLTVGERVVISGTEQFSNAARVTLSQ